jgi:threonine/homoserine/homoserine lactone efflux protein
MLQLLHIDPTTFMTYCVAALALVVAPGPGQALVVTRTIQGGVRSGVMTAAGLAIGTLLHTLGAAFGLSAVLAASATAFVVVQYAGALYLIVLGLRTLRGARLAAAPARAQGPAAHSQRALLMHGALTGVLNPKVAIFFLAFLPQFVHPEQGAVLMQFMTLGAVLALFGLGSDATIAGLVSRARGRLLSSPRFASWRESLTGAVLVALGLRLVLVQRR